MEMCYDGTLVMPCSYVVMSEDEMTYMEGGAYYEARHTLGYLRDVFAELTIVTGLITALAGIGTICSAIFSVPALYYGYLTEKLANCYTQVEKWIASTSYTKKTMGYFGLTVLCGMFITDISVSLKPN